MRPLLAFRLALDIVAVGLLLTAFAYNWQGNLVHEIIGTAMFVLLISHNIFNRRWYGTIAKSRRSASGIFSKTITLSLLATMLTLLATSVIISEAVFSFLPLTSTFTVRQIHALVAYLALLIAALHLGLSWSMIIGFVRRKIGLTENSRVCAYISRATAILITVYGIESLFSINIGSKLFMRVTMEFWNFETSTLQFFLHHIAIIGLFACLSHYIVRVIKVVQSLSSSKQVA